MSHFNELLPSQVERLSVLAEGMGEAIQVIGKILRHGYDSSSPDDSSATTNRRLLEKELGDVYFAIDWVSHWQDVSAAAIVRRSKEKREKIKPYLHHSGINWDHLSAPETATKEPEQS